MYSSLGHQKSDRTPHSVKVNTRLDISLVTKCRLLRHVDTRIRAFERTARIQPR